MSNFNFEALIEFLKGLFELLKKLFGFLAASEA